MKTEEMEVADSLPHNQFVISDKAVKQGINGDVNFGYDSSDPGRYILYFLEVYVWIEERPLAN